MRNCLSVEETKKKKGEKRCFVRETPSSPANSCFVNSSFIRLNKISTFIRWDFEDREKHGRERRVFIHSNEKIPTAIFF
jgi:hypothetical protein